MIELVINNQNVDIPKSLGVRLTKVLYNPKNVTGDKAEYSYSLTLSASETNNRVFGFVNSEEVKAKFNKRYNAFLYIDGIQVFAGVFLLSEITEYEYKGNLVVPKQTPIKDIFGNDNLNDIASEWLYEFDVPNGYTALEYLSEKNKSIANGLGGNNDYTPDVIFPYVLYGLVPKVAIKDDHIVNGENVGLYSAKNLIDYTARFNVEDFPPSVNVLTMLRKQFEARGLQLKGNVFSDDRLRLLFMSYSNPTEYPQEWNYGSLGGIELDAEWATHAGNENVYPKHEDLERHIYNTAYNAGGDYDSTFKISYCDILRSNNIKVNRLVNKGGNANLYTSKDKLGKDVTNVDLVIPADGWYKIDLEISDYQINTRWGSDTWTLKGIDGGEIRYSTAKQSQKSRKNHFHRSRYEVSLLRDFGTGMFDLDRFCQVFSRPNFPQPKGDVNPHEWNDKRERLYPRNNNTQVIDPSVNQQFVCGIGWGAGDSGLTNQVVSDRGTIANPAVMKNGWSVNADFSQKEKINAVYNSSINDYNANRDGNYHKWGVGYSDSENEDIPARWYYTKERYGELRNAPYNSAVSKYRNAWGTYSDGYSKGSGEVHTIMYFKKGERLALNYVGNLGDKRSGSNKFDSLTMLVDSLRFKLRVTPFRDNLDWGNFTDDGNYDPSNVLDWNDSNMIQRENIDLNRFLPSEMKLNDFVENFCKAFNLKLSYSGGNAYSLDRNIQNVKSSISLDLDDKINITQRTNEPLDIPSEIKMGFTIKEGEQGFEETGDDGSGSFLTGSLNPERVDDKTQFSFNWFKTMNVENSTPVDLPIISDKEVWDDQEDYREMLDKYFSNFPIRFWYPEKKTKELQRGVVTILVSNRLDYLAKSELTYHNRPYTILRSFFDIIVSNDSDYTVLSLYLSAYEYSILTKSSLVRWNNDTYRVASVDGYDTSEINRCKLKLIREVNK